MNSSFSRPWESFRDLLIYDHGKVEKSVDGDYSQTPGLQSEALYSSLEDLWNIFQSKWVRGSFLDIGAGIGIPSLFYGSLYTDRKSTGVESSQARFLEGQKLSRDLQLQNVELQLADLLVVEIEKADTYYFYFPTGPVLDRVLFELYRRQDVFTCVVVESHGDLVERFEKEPWLKLKEKILLTSSRHNPHAYIFESVPGVKRNSTLHDISFQERFLWIDQDWIGESMGLEWQGGESFNLQIPPRTISQNQVSSVVNFHELSDTHRKLVSLRRLGELNLVSAQGSHRGFIRKIGSGPTFYVELSTGEKLEWSSIKSISWENHLCYDSSSHFYSLPHAP